MISEGPPAPAGSFPPPKAKPILDAVPGPTKVKGLVGLVGSLG